MRKSLPALACLPLVFFSALLVFSCGPAEVVTTGTLSGRITVDGATTGNIGFMVANSGTDYLAVTDDAGDFEITDIPAGAGYALFISPPTGSTVKAVLHDSAFSVIAGQTTDAGTIDLEAVAETRTVTMTITNIPAGYGTARLRFYNNYQLNTNYNPETVEYYSNTAVITGGQASMTYEIPSEKINNLQRREVTLSIILFPSANPDVPASFASWKASYTFLISNTFSYNTSVEEGNFVIAVPGLGEFDGFAFKGTPAWYIGSSISYYHLEQNGTRTAYSGFTQQGFDTLITNVAPYGNNFIFIVWPFPDYFGISYTWNGIGTSFAYSTLTTLAFADADTRTKELYISLYDSDADTQNALDTEASMIIRTGTADTVVTLPRGQPIYIDAEAWDAMMASGFTVSITLADTIYTWLTVFNYNRVYLSFLDATETPAP